MPYYDSEAIERARQVDLLTYLQTCEPQELVHVSGKTNSYVCGKMGMKKSRLLYERINGLIQSAQYVVFKFS